MCRGFGGVEFVGLAHQRVNHDVGGVGFDDLVGQGVSSGIWTSLGRLTWAASGSQITWLWKEIQSMVKGRNGLLGR